MKQFVNDRVLLIVLTLFFVAAVAIPRLRFPDFDHGDEYSDSSMMISGENFMRFGFIACRFLPLFELNLEKPTNPYTNAPPLSDIMNGMVRIIFKTESIRVFRAVALFFSLCTILLWYLFVKQWTSSYGLSFLAALFYIANPMFICVSDSLYQNAYTDCIRALIFLIFITMLRSPSSKKYGLIIIWFLLVIEGLFSFEYIVYFALFFMLFRIFFKKSGVSLSWFEIIFLYSASCVGFFLHFLQKAWYSGSFSSATLDLIGTAVRRIAQSTDSPLPLNLFTWWQYVFLRNFSLVFSFNFFILLLSVFLGYLLYQRLSSEAKKKAWEASSLFIVLAVCGVSWYVTFPAHSLAHTFVLFLARHLVPAASIASALFCYVSLSFIKEAKSRNYYALGLWIVMIAAILWTGISRSDIPVTTENIKKAREFLKFKECLVALRRGSVEKSRIGANYFRFPFLRYYTHRNVQCFVDKVSLEKEENLPEYFIFFPYTSAQSAQLLQFLNEKYTLLFQCDSQRFGGLFFKIKG